MFFVAHIFEYFRPNRDTHFAKKRLFEQEHLRAQLSRPAVWVTTFYERLKSAGGSILFRKIGLDFVISFV
jgi:hypothetical protein